MLYKFKSRATADVIMLEPNGRRVLEVIGKDAGPQGIILPDQMPAAISALESAIAQEESAQKEAAGTQAHDNAGRDPAVSLRQRAVPFLDMLRRCQAQNAEVTWDT